MNSQDEIMGMVATEAAEAIEAGKRSAPSAGSAWREISTAPKDGSDVLLVVELRAGIKGRMLVGHYMPGGHCIEDHPAIDEGWYFWNGSMFDKASRPTHWMPLPKTPNEKAAP